MNRVVIEDDPRRKDDVDPEMDDFRKASVSRPSNRLASFLRISYFLERRKQFHCSLLRTDEP